jgi:hypothetical protein
MRLVEGSRRRVLARLGTERAAQLNLARALLHRRKHVLFFSHMRSYSTLLGHLIGSHPQVSGYTEQHQSYRSFADLTSLSVGVWKVSDYRLHGDYLFDKVLHDTLVISDDMLRREDVIPIYGVREPISSLRSIVAMGRRKRRPIWSEPDRASQHLAKRYAEVRDLCQRRENAAALFTDSIVTAPERTLTDLSRYLGLDSPIQPTFQSFPKTGVGGFGDPSGPIDAGRIVVDRPTHDVDIPESVAARLVDDYRETCALLVSRCTTVLGAPVGV